MTDVRLPGTLAPLFPGLPRRLEIEAATVLAAIDEIDAQRAREGHDLGQVEQEAVARVDLHGANGIVVALLHYSKQ